MTSKCPYCHRPIEPGERVVFTTDCRLDGLHADGYSVAFDVESRSMVVHRACWDQMLANRAAPNLFAPDKTNPVESRESASVERTDALHFLE